ncbi:hematopoietic prostaglandin D synthase-like isoform X4 [Biomphalaria glabrata]|uniref:Hematopoietic prostaglandin D synthase-like isoform X4 n=1 Tax=Biomphalaria glabrata TaxID=6526 RepID=A0A9W3A273_BIOGL|nr:hematopoietic prostaglandin D synthase-like isoform X4 [Biomphalaria glabrata]
MFYQTEVMASPSPKYKLYYFNFRGRGELIRLLLHTAQVEFIDHRVQPSDWPELKPNTPEGHVPFLEVDGVQYGESLPLARYLAKKYNLMGDTELDQLNADIILNYVDQLRLDYVRFKTDSLLTPEQKLSIADLAVADVLDTFIKENPSVLNSYPSLSDHKAMVMGLPQLSNYLSCRPDTKL